MGVDELASEFINLGHDVQYIATVLSSTFSKLPPLRFQSWTPVHCLYMVLYLLPTFQHRLPPSYNLDPLTNIIHRCHGDRGSVKPYLSWSQRRKCSRRRLQHSFRLRGRNQWWLPNGRFECCWLCDGRYVSFSSSRLRHFGSSVYSRCPHAYHRLETVLGFACLLRGLCASSVLQFFHISQATSHLLPTPFHDNSQPSRPQSQFVAHQNPSIISLTLCFEPCPLGLHGLDLKNISS